MPFQPILTVEVPNWLYAKTHRVLGLTGLIVYRSEAVRDTDAAYAPVQRVLDGQGWQLLEQQLEETKEMMFGMAELSLYALRSEMQEFAAGMVMEWLTEMREEIGRFLEL